MEKRSILKKTLNTGILSFIMVLTATPCTYADNVQEGAYVGLDGVYSKIRFKRGYGENIFSEKAAPGLNVSGGYMFNGNFGLEVGFEIEKKKRRIDTVFLREYVVGSYLDPNDPSAPDSQTYNTKIYQRHPYMGVKTKINITDNHGISLLAGVSVSHVKAEYNMFKRINNAGVSVPVNPGIMFGTFSKTRFVPMVRVSIEHAFNRVGFRVFSSWRNTATFTKIAKERVNGKIRLKDTVNLGAGIMYYI